MVSQPFFEQKNLKGIDDVLLALERLGHDLPAADLALLDSFNKTYLVITRNVRQQLRNGKFEHPEFLEQFDRRFAHYYLRALQGYLQKDTGSSVPYAWHKEFQAAEKRSKSAFVCMALGVNAHVNNDIPQVLRDCNESSKHVRDYLLVNDIIGKSLEEVIGPFKHSGGRLNPNKRLLRPVYMLIMRQLIRRWRRTAWQQFEQLQQRQTQVQDIEESARRMSSGISKLPV